MKVSFSETRLMLLCFSITFQTRPQDSKKFGKSMMTRSSKSRGDVSLFIVFSRQFNDRRMGSDVNGEVLG